MPRNPEFDGGYSLEALIEGGMVVPAKDGWRAEHVPYIGDTLEKLYGGRRVQFFPEAHQCQNWGSWEGHNVNQLQASEYLLGRLRANDVLLFIVGAMWAGKDGVASVVSWKCPDKVQVLQHLNAARRSGIDQLVMKDWHGQLKVPTGIPATPFETFNELTGLVKVQRGGIVVANEIQFTHVTEGELREWRGWLEQHDMKALVLGLDLTFAGEPWPYMEGLLEVADGGVVLAAKCMKCELPRAAWMSMREVALRNGIVRPAALSDALEVVAADLNKGLSASGDGNPLDVVAEGYLAVCGECHWVLTEGQLVRFNSTGEITW